MALVCSPAVFQSLYLSPLSVVFFPCFLPQHHSQSLLFSLSLSSRLFSFSFCSYSFHTSCFPLLSDLAAIGTVRGLCQQYKTTVYAIQVSYPGGREISFLHSLPLRGRHCCLTNYRLICVRRHTQPALTLGFSEERIIGIEHSVSWRKHSHAHPALFSTTSRST